MKKNRKSLIIALCLIAIIIVAVLWYNFKPDTGAEKTAEKITIGMVTFPGYAPLYLAKEKKLFKNVNVELVRIESIGDLRAAMHSNKIDMYIATPDIFQSTQNQKPPGVGFLAIDESSGADGIAVLEGVNSLSDLRGKTLGAEPGFPPYFILQYMLNREGMTLNDINFKDISSQDAGNAFVAGQLEAVGTYEPYLSKSVNLRKGARVFVSSADLQGLIVDVIFSNNELAEKKPQVLKAVRDGWYRALEFYRNNPDEGMEIMAKAFGISKEEMIDIKSGLKWLDASDNKSLFDQSKKTNLYTNFNLVGEILEKNNANGFRVYAKDKLIDAIIRN
ncbi:MAG: ABC transporter substrate-binding protein [Bacteroidota bacterium]